METNMYVHELFQRLCIFVHGVKL